MSQDKAYQVPELKPQTVYVVDDNNLTNFLAEGVKNDLRIFVYPTDNVSEHESYWQTLSIQTGLTPELAQKINAKDHVVDYFTNLSDMDEYTLVCIPLFDQMDSETQQEILQSAVTLGTTLLIQSAQEGIEPTKKPKFSLRRRKHINIEYYN